MWKWIGTRAVTPRSASRSGDGAIVTASRHASLSRSRQHPLNEPANSRMLSLQCLPLPSIGDAGPSLSSRAPSTSSRQRSGPNTLFARAFSGSVNGRVGFCKSPRDDDLLAPICCVLVGRVESPFELFQPFRVTRFPLLPSPAGPSHPVQGAEMTYCVELSYRLSGAFQGLDQPISRPIEPRRGWPLALGSGSGSVETRG